MVAIFAPFLHYHYLNLLSKFYNCALIIIAYLRVAVTSLPLGRCIQIPASIKSLLSAPFSKIKSLPC